MKWSSDGAKLQCAAECSLLLGSAGVDAGSTGTQQFLRLCLGCLEFMCKICCAWGKKFPVLTQPLLAAFQDRSTGKKFKLLVAPYRGGCPVHPVYCLSLFRLSFIRSRASNAVQVKGCLWVHLTKPAPDAGQWEHQCCVSKRDATGSKFPASSCSWIPVQMGINLTQSCQLL